MLPFPRPRPGPQTRDPHTNDSPAKCDRPSNWRQEKGWRRSTGVAVGEPKLHCATLLTPRLHLPARDEAYRWQAGDALRAIVQQTITYVLCTSAHCQEITPLSIFSKGPGMVLEAHASLPETQTRTTHKRFSYKWFSMPRVIQLNQLRQFLAKACAKPTGVRAEQR